MNNIQFPKIMGIVNVTPDSFSDGGKFFSKDKAVEQALLLIEDGADILDIGGESTRQGSLPVAVDEELERVIPVIKQIKKYKPQAIISIDTSKSQVALESVKSGATIINDITALGSDIELARIAAKYDCTLILMHIQGTPRIMQDKPQYDNVVNEIFNYLKDRINLAKSYNVTKIIADVGIGFGKTTEHNIELIRNIDYFSNLQVPLMLGISRKRFIGNIFGIENPLDRDFHTVIIHSALLTKNLEYIRVHNVRLISDLKKAYELFT